MKSADAPSTASVALAELARWPIDPRTGRWRRLRAIDTHTNAGAANRPAQDH